MRASQVELVVKNPPANAGDLKDVGSIPVSGKIPWRRAWQPTPVFLPGESYGQRSLVGYSPWGRKESDMTERLHFHFHLNIFVTASRVSEGKRKHEDQENRVKGIYLRSVC